MAERRSRSIRSPPGIRWWGWSVDRSAPATGCRPGEMLQRSCVLCPCLVCAEKRRPETEVSTI